jgi:hypothetical protein
MIWPEPTAFMLTHCQYCALKDILIFSDGREVMTCLHDDNPIPSDITNCDRYRPKASTRDRPTKS